MAHPPMSRFNCEHCGALCANSPAGYISGCEHYPPDINTDERTPCERWTRVMGYHRPVSAFNPGKQAEHAERKYFEEDKAGAW